MSTDEQRHDESRRLFVKKAVYITPAIVTLRALPSFASTGSAWSDDAKDEAREAAKQAKDDAKEAAKEAKDEAKEAKESAKASR